MLYRKLFRPCVTCSQLKRRRSSLQSLAVEAYIYEEIFSPHKIRISIQIRKTELFIFLSERFEVNVVPCLCAVWPCEPSNAAAADYGAIVLVGVLRLDIA